MKEILGHFLYDGKHTTQQVPDIKLYFEKLLCIENFEIIIELGTSFGGLTYILSDILKENNLNCKIHTFDFSYKSYVEDSLIERGCTYHILDERDEIYKETVVNLLTNYGKALLLCDGGNKKEEFNRYSEYLKPNDVIMAHDYSHNVNVFENEIKNKYWNWFEISFLDIEETTKKYKLIEYPKLSFKEAVWACFVKI
jgi:hypothetical protein